MQRKWLQPLISKYKRLNMKVNLRECLGSGRDNKELLECKLVSGMISTVDHVETGDRKGVGDGVSSNISIVLPKRNATGRCTSLASGKRD